MRFLWPLPLLLAAVGCSTAGQPSATTVPPRSLVETTSRAPAPRRARPSAEPQIAVGSSYACGLRADGRVLCWGVGASGQLGDGLALPVPRAPVEVPLIEVRQLAAGAHHACALLAHGEVFCWGSNAQGQLALQPDERPHHPVRLPLPPARALADNPLCALSEDDEVFCWGEAAPEALRDAHGVAHLASLPPSRAVSVSDGEACAISTDAEMLCWTSSGVSKVPIPVSLIQLSSRAGSGCALGKQGQAFCWGDLPRRQGDVPAPPTLIRGLTGATRLRVGDGLGCALRKEGTVACWGDLLRGGPWSWDLERVSPSGIEATEVPGVAGAVDVAIGDGFSCALRGDGQVLCWGSNQHGIVNASADPVVLAPRIVPGVDLR